MVNLEFNVSIEWKGTVYNILPADMSDVSHSRFIIKKGDRIPFIACFTGLGTVPVKYNSRLCYSLLDTESILKLFVSGSHVRFTPIRKHNYYVGKGMLLDGEMRTLAMMTVSEQYYNYYRANTELTEEQIKQHFTLVISHQFEQDPAHRALFSKFRREYKKATFNKTFTADPEFESFCRLTIPTFNSLSERKLFIETQFSQGLHYLLTQ